MSIAFPPYAAHLARRDGALTGRLRAFQGELGVAPRVWIQPQPDDNIPVKLVNAHAIAASVSFA
jgi:hypothetical protein